MLTSLSIVSMVSTYRSFLDRVGIDGARRWLLRTGRSGRRWRRRRLRLLRLVVQPGAVPGGRRVWRFRQSTHTKKSYDRKTFFFSNPSFTIAGTVFIGFQPQFSSVSFFWFLLECVEIQFEFVRRMSFMVSFLICALCYVSFQILSPQSSTYFEYKCLALKRFLKTKWKPTADETSLPFPISSICWPNWIALTLIGKAAYNGNQASLLGANNLLSGGSFGTGYYANTIAAAASSSAAAGGNGKTSLHYGRWPASRSINAHETSFGLGSIGFDPLRPHFSNFSRGYHFVLRQFLFKYFKRR